MIETTYTLEPVALVRHRVTGQVDRQQAAEGAAQALDLVQQLAGAHGPIALVLDLRRHQFMDLQAHRTWSEGFARNPALGGRVRAVAIVGDDTPAFQAERELMQSERVRFFAGLAEAERWLAQTDAPDRNKRNAN